MPSNSLEAGGSFPVVQKKGNCTDDHVRAQFSNRKDNSANNS